MRDWLLCYQYTDGCCWVTCRWRNARNGSAGAWRDTGR